jgi:uncharacterized protein YdeI (BOF family)
MGKQTGNAMSEQQQMELIRQLPELLQTIVILILIALSVTGIGAGIRLWIHNAVETRNAKRMAEIQAENAKEVADQKARLTEIEVKTLKMESEVDSQRAMHAHIEKMITMNGEIAQRRSDDAREFRDLTNNMQMNLNATLRELTNTLNGIRETNELQTLQYGQLKHDVVTEVEAITITTHHTNTIVSDMKADLQQVQFGLGKLSSIVDDLVTNQEAHIESAGKRHTEQLASNSNNHAELTKILAGINLLNNFIHQLQDTPQPLPSLPVIIKNDNEGKEE